MAAFFRLLLVIFTLIGGHEPVVTKWSDIDCTIQIFDTNYFKGDTVFSWRIKAIPDVQRLIRRVNQVGVKPRSVKTTGTCEWILCSRSNPSKKCSKVPGNAELPHQSEWKWVDHELAFVRLLTDSDVRNRPNLEALPLKTSRQTTAAAPDDFNEPDERAEAANFLLTPNAHNSTIFDEEDESSGGPMMEQIGFKKENASAAAELSEENASYTVVTPSNSSQKVVPDAQLQKSESAQGPGEADDSLGRRKSETPEAPAFALPVVKQEKAQKVIEYESKKSPEETPTVSRGFQGWRYQLQSILAEHLRKEKSTSGKLLPEKPTDVRTTSTTTVATSLHAEQEAFDEVKRTPLEEENKELASMTSGTTSLPYTESTIVTASSGSLLITREEEEEEEAKPEEVDERRQTFPMSKNNNNEKRNESHDSRQLILFCIGVGGSAVVAIVAFMAFKFARMMPAGSFEKQLKIVSEKANRKLCARRSEFMSLGQFDYYHNDDDEERSG